MSFTTSLGRFVGPRFIPRVSFFPKNKQSLLRANAPCLAAHAATSSHAVPFQSHQPAPILLPQTPETVKLATVLPYLTRLVLSDRQQHWRTFAAVALMLISKVTGFAAPYFMKVAVEKITAGPAFAMQCVFCILLFGMVRCVSGVTNDLQFPIFSPVAQSAGRRLTSSVFQHLLDLDIGYHLNNRTGALSAIIDRGTRSVQVLFRTLVFRMIPTVIETICVCAVLGRIFSPYVSLILFLTLATYVAYSIQTIGISVKIRERMIQLENLQSGKAIDALQNFETVSLFNNQQLETFQYNDLLEGYQEVSIAHERIMAKLNSGQGFIVSAGITLALACTVMLSSGGVPASPGDLVFMQGVIAQLMVPLSFFGWFYRESRQGLTDMQQFLQILNTESKIKDGTIDLADISETYEYAHNGRFEGYLSHQRGLDVAIEDVHFRYTPDREVLKGVTLDIPAGTSVALVGGSGSGKSTLLKLIVRLYDADEGSISFNGGNVKDLTRQSFRSAIGVVPQDTVLFNDTLYQNILYGKPSATTEEVYEAAKMAQLDTAIRRLPDGYATMVGERGLKLSGGEKQRVAIARTFLRSPRLIVCDEATSSLDTATEKEIMSSLERLAKGRTSIFVAHRLSTIQDCDKIVVLANGRVVEQGTHRDLMAKQGAYYDMWQAQARSDALQDEMESFVAPL